MGTGKKKLSNQIVLDIEDKIVSGYFPPASHLDEQQLADLFQVSRTPIREALIKLSLSGLVELRSGKGAIVPQFDLKKICEMFEVMAELESICAKLTARRILPEELDQLIKSHEACQIAVERNDPDLYYALNEVFHLNIYKYSKNKFLIEQTELLQKRLRPYRRLQLRVRDRIQNSFAEHTKIIKAIIKNDAHLIEKCMKEHIIIQGERFSDLLSSYEKTHS